MKKALTAILLVILLVLGAAWAEETAEAGENEPQPEAASVWILPEDLTIPQEVRADFDRAVETLLGVTYEPITLLGEKDGVFCILCRAAVVYPDDEPSYALVYVGQDGVEGIRELQLDADSAPGKGPDSGAMDGEEEDTVDYGTLFSDLADAWAVQNRIGADLEALHDDLAADVAAAWKQIYLNPDYRLFIHGADDPFSLPVAGKHAFVILGFELQDGEMTDELRARCNAAAAAARAFPDSILVCSGGATGDNNPDGHTEAGLMKEYLVQACGIAPGRIFIDEEAMTTVDNALNTFGVLKEQGIEEITLVTSSYHQRRAQMLYYTLSAFMRQRGDYAVELVGNFGNNAEAPEGLASVDAYIAAFQMDEMLRFLAGNDSADAEETGDDPLSLWTEDSLAREMLVSYVEAVTDEEGEEFIPPEDRIAVFDLDGTLFCETDPNYFDYMLLVHRVLEDPDYKDQASDFEREIALKIVQQNETGASLKGLEVDHGRAIASSFAGMTLDAFNAYIQAFKKQPMPSYEGMNRGDGWYQPMLQVVDYLQANGFTVYVVSGTDRFIVRGIAYDSPLHVPPRQIIGSDETVVASSQGGTDGLDYVFVEDDTLILGGDFMVKNLKMNKVAVIIQEIGQQPVLSFGNSTGDASMAEYVTSANPYPSMAFMLCCDDLERENGDESKAGKMYTLCENFGWVPVSMKDDWQTIYGDGVTKK